MPVFTPEQTGSDSVLSEILQPLAALKGDLWALTGIKNAALWVCESIRLVMTVQLSYRA